MARPPKAPRDSTIRIPLLTEQDIVGRVDAQGNVRFTGKGLRVIHDLVRRTGGQVVDAVAQANSTANTAAATANANSAGITVPVPGGAVELNPANPLSVEIVDNLTANILMASHTRTGAGAAIVASSVLGVSRGLTYYVWYADPTNACGSVTPVAAQTLETFTANDRLVGTISVAEPRPTSGIDVEIIL